jgi:hypothetical protein
LQFSEVSDARILKSSWQTFSYEGEVAGKSARVQGQQTIYVAFGWSGADASIGLDDIDILIFPAP